MTPLLVYLRIPGVERKAQAPRLLVDVECLCLVCLFLTWFSPQDTRKDVFIGIWDEYAIWKRKIVSIKPSAKMPGKVSRNAHL